MPLSTDNFKIKQYSDTPLEDLLNEYAINRDDFRPLPEEPVIETPTADPMKEEPTKTEPVITEEIQKPKHSERELKGKRDFTARSLAKNTDRAFAFLLALIADTDDVNEWKAIPEDIEDIRVCYYEMFETYGWGGLPPWVNLIACIGLTYAPAIKEARKMRGMNQELAREAASAQAALEIERQKNKVLTVEKTEPAQTEKQPEVIPADGNDTTAN